MPNRPWFPPQRGPKTVLSTRDASKRRRNSSDRLRKKDKGSSINTEALMTIFKLSLFKEFLSLN